MPEQELRRFLEIIWGDNVGVVKVASRTKDLRFRSTLFKWPAHEEAILNYITSNDGAGHDVYFSPDLFMMTAISDKKATKEYVLGSRVVCLDFDGNAPDPNTWDDEGTYKGIPLPSIRVQSSTADRQHLYWVLDEFITDITQLEGMRRKITYDLGADGSGWDAGQLLRPPYTTNYGHGKARVETYDVFLEELSERTYSRDVFPAPTDFRNVVREAIDPSQVPSIIEVLARNTFVDGFTDAFGAGPDIGKRSDALMAVAYFGAESGLSDLEVYALVLDADNRWGKYAHRNDKHKRYCDIIERARAKYPVGYHQRDVGFNFDEATGPDIEVREVYNWKDLITSDVHIEWFFEDLLSKTGYGLFTGTAGIGKTQLAIRFGIAVALNKEFINTEGDSLEVPWHNTSNGPGRVLFFSLEMNHASIKKFITHMKDLDPDIDTLGDRFFIYPMGNEMVLDDKKSRTQFERIISEYKPTLVIIDSLSRVLNRSLVDDTAVRELNSFLALMREKYQCAMIGVHHSKKLQDRKDRYFIGDLDIVYGSRFIVSDADFVFVFTHGGPNRIKVHSAKMRFSPPIPTFELQRNPADLSFEAHELVIDSEVDANVSGLYSLLKSGFEPRKGDAKPE